jgi:Protein of unknown function (DUF3302)
MSFIDVFAWIVLLMLVATAVAVFVALGMMPGRIARKRGHPWPEAVTVGSFGPPWSSASCSGRWS